MEYFYLAIHGILTLGLVVGFLIRIEHRLTRLETKVENLERHLKCPTS